jgi:hypothetical protein
MIVLASRHIGTRGLKIQELGIARSEVMIGEVAIGGKATIAWIWSYGGSLARRDRA